MNPSVRPPKPAAPSKTEFRNETPTGEAETLPRFFWSGCHADLAFLARVGNNLFVTVMRLACGLAIALWLSFPTAGMASRRQDPAGSTNGGGQAPAPPAPPAETAPAEKPPAQSEKPQTEHAPAEQVPAKTTPAAPANPQTPDAGKTAPESVAKEKTDAGSASGNKRRRTHAPSTPNGAPHKIEVREGRAIEPAAQIAPGMTPAEASRQRHNAEQLLGATDEQLKGLAGRPLDARKHAAAEKGRSHLTGARSALEESDVRRGT